uniref:Uncharacterized protein n=1 Tax=Plectus sambesii TaxID=2011161 RepID=A0A914XJ39_9BILA
MLGVFILALALSSTQATYFEDRAACSSHKDYPNTFQCGTTKKCLSITEYRNGKADCCEPDQDCKDYSDEAAYFTNGPERNTLEKPGRYCFGHPSYPDTMQCAKTKRCISLEQYRDKKYDCCGPDATTCDEDQSDENRIDPPGQCENHPDLNINGVKMSFQCAETKECLSQLNQPNGKCDCCGPSSNCSNCADHSDEDPCRPQDWLKTTADQPTKEKFSCAGTCRDISQLTDNVWDCQYECVETGPGIRDQCRAALQKQQDSTATDWCTKLESKKTPYFSCMAMGTTDLIEVCVEPSKVRDGKYECDDGTDESLTHNPDCTAEEKAQYCSEDTFQCVKIDNRADQVDCRCNSAVGGQQACFKGGKGRKRK